MSRILITGGAGFIGRHLASALASQGSDVVVVDSMIEQAHPGGGSSEPAFARNVTFIKADIRDSSALVTALDGVDRVVHLAAEVGVGQSMYAINRYVGANDCGTAVLFEALAQSSVQRVVVASSMSVYGEGQYRDHLGNTRTDAQRTLGLGECWDPLDETGKPLVPIPTPESKPVNLASVYALTKYVQERLTMMLCDAYGIEGCALRLFNTFGPGQSLSNPYTGVLAIFASRLLNDRRPLVFEDGHQQRDFVHVADVVDAFVAALYENEAVGQVFNIGSGRHRSIIDVARLLAHAMRKSEIEPEILEKARAGDVRHCFADITLAKNRLGFRPKRTLEDSLSDFKSWLLTQTAVDRLGEARAELEERGLVT